MEEIKYHQLFPKKLAEWQQARMDAGASKYHHLDHCRDHILDIAEELLDAKNIILRLLHHHPHMAQNTNLQRIDSDLALILFLLSRLSREMGDLPDDNAHPRIWIESQKGGDISQ